MEDNLFKMENNLFKFSIIDIVLIILGVLLFLFFFYDALITQPLYSYKKSELFYSASLNSRIENVRCNKGIYVTISDTVYNCSFDLERKYKKIDHCTFLEVGDSIKKNKDQFEFTLKKQNGREYELQSFLQSKPWFYSKYPPR